MRPSQYHYIKRAVTRTAYNRKMQKKRAKKRKKELRKKNRRKKLYTFQKNLEKSSGQHDSPGFKITLLVLAEILFGILTLFQTINFFANWTKYVKENGIIGTIFLFILNIAILGGLTYLFSYLIKEDKKKDTDTLQFDDSAYRLVTKEKSLTDRANAVLEHEYKTLVEDLNKLDVERKTVSEKEIKIDNIEIPTERINKRKNQNDVQKTSIPKNHFELKYAVVENPDPYLKEASELFIKNGKASVGMLQRTYKIGFYRADRILKQLEKMGIVSSEFGTHPREVLASPEDIDVAFSNTTFRTFSTEEKVKREENERIKDFSDAFASLCVANCELDKEQNYTDDVTGGNVKYNEKRFDNLTNDSVISQIISDEKIKEVSDKILHMYSEVGLMVMIDGSLCTNQYVVLKLKPMHGTRINDVISIQRSIESAIGMKSLMNVMYKKGYIGILLPIYHFIEKEKNPTTGK
jgi:hypothetical protein